MSIKRIEAIIRPERLQPLVSQLEEAGYPGLMVTEIEGHGKQHGVVQTWRGKSYRSYFLPKVKVELVVQDRAAKKIIDTILDVCNNGKVGDGKIFVSEIKEVIRIRTKEKGRDAI